MSGPAGAARALVVWCPDWPVTAAGYGPADLVAVVAANRVVACSAAARAEGVRRGLRRREAQARCPEVTVVAADPGRDARAFEAVAGALEALCPRIEVVRPGVCAFATRGPSRYFGGDAVLATRARTAASEALITAMAMAGTAPPAASRPPGTAPPAASRPASASPVAPAPPSRRAAPSEPASVRSGPTEPNGLTTPLVGVADGVFAATLAARAAASRRQVADGPTPDGTTPDGTTSDGTTPDGTTPDGTTPDGVSPSGVVIVPAGASRAFLAPFPVASLDRPELADLLARLGISTLGAFADLPPGQVLARFGVPGEIAHRLARGLEERPLAARTPPPDLAVQAEIDPPADRVDRAAFVAKSLADSLHDELGRRGLACTRIAIEAETEHGEQLVRVWRHDGALTAGAIAERVRWQLDGWLNAVRWGDRPTAGIAFVRLAPEEVRPDTGRQLGFWGGVTLNDERASRALARVQGMLGVDAVCTPVLQGGRSPSERIRLVPWGDAREPSRPPGPPWPGQVPAPAPALVHDPIPAEVADGAGRLVAVTGRGLCSAPPAWVRIDGGGEHEVVAWAGPWPVDERWWDAAARRRRARFQIVRGDGTAHLVAVEGGRWWVEATYD